MLYRVHGSIEFFSSIISDNVSEGRLLLSFRVQLLGKGRNKPKPPTSPIKQCNLTSHDSF
jgi:hypothetical protein